MDLSPNVRRFHGSCGRLHRPHCSIAISPGAKLDVELRIAVRVEDTSMCSVTPGPRGQVWLRLSHSVPHENTGRLDDNEGLLVHAYGPVLPDGKRANGRHVMPTKHVDRRRNLVYARWTLLPPAGYLPCEHMRSGVADIGTPARASSSVARQRGRPTTVS